MDEMVEEYTCRRKTVRWPLLLAFNIIDIACLNGYLLMKNDGYQKRRKNYLKAVALQLATPFAVRRHQMNKHLPNSSKQAASLLGFIEMCPTTSVSSFNGPRRCVMCGRHSRSACDTCNRAICPQHRHLTKSCKCDDCFNL